MTTMPRATTRRSACLAPRAMPMTSTNLRRPLPRESSGSGRDGCDPWSTFEELRLDNVAAPDVGEHNLFELLVRRDQQAYLGTDLVEAFCGVFGIGSQGNGDTYHIEIYEWDGPAAGAPLRSRDARVHRRVRGFARQPRLPRGDREGRRSERARSPTRRSTIGLRKLRGKVAPTWHFSIDDNDADFVALDAEAPRHRVLLLPLALDRRAAQERRRHRRRRHPAPVHRRLQPGAPAGSARRRASRRARSSSRPRCTRCGARSCSTSPSSTRYLEIGRRHAARLVRDAAKLIDELRGGRNELGTITDVRARLAAFRALDLDPRRADARKAEATRRRARRASRTEARRRRARAHAARAWTTSRGAGSTTASRTARCSQARRAREAAAQLAALDELRELGDDEREVAVPCSRAELAPELEAVLVGSLVRDDRLDGRAARPDAGGDERRRRATLAGLGRDRSRARADLRHQRAARALRHRRAVHARRQRSAARHLRLSAQRSAAALALRHLRVHRSVRARRPTIPRRAASASS